MVVSDSSLGAQRRWPSPQLKGFHSQLSNPVSSSSPQLCVMSPTLFLGSTHLPVFLSSERIWDYKEKEKERAQTDHRDQLRWWLLGFQVTNIPRDQRQEIELLSHFIIKVEEIVDFLDVTDSIGVYLENECN